MAYQYITENNLVHKQNYMYSEYRGKEFLQDFFDSRKKLTVQNDIEEISNMDVKLDETLSELIDLEQELRRNGISSANIECVRKYLKSFEVRKRLYSAYDVGMKPKGDAVYDNYDSYLVMADILRIIFEKTKCLKYFSCLLKLNDTLLSIADNLNIGQLQKLAIILKWEQSMICILLQEHQVRGGGINGV